MHKDLTQGSITKTLILFALPLILGNILQQFYNVVDTFVVGKIIGASALAAVGATYSIMTFITSIILGLCMGAGVLFSMFYGARKENELKNSFVVSFLFIFFLSVVITCVTLSMKDSILNFLNIPNDIYDMTKRYFNIVCFGIVFTFLYNYFASLSRALGDSKTPFVFLGISTVLNIVLDILFVVYVYRDVSSVAYATVIAQGASALSMMLYCIKTKSSYMPKLEHCHYNSLILNKFLNYSLLTCLQQSVMNFGIMMVSGLVNSFGVSVMAGFNTAVKIDTIAYMPSQDFGNAFSTFIAQNTGANNKERVEKGLKTSMLISTLFNIVMSIFIFVSAKNLMMMFVNVKEIEVIRIGVEYLRIEGTCYIGIGILFLWYGYYRGIGKAHMSVVLTIISLGTRVLFAYVLSSYIGVIGIWISIPLGWFLADITGIIFYLKKKHFSK